MALLILFFFILLVTIGLGFLQVYLSRKKSKWPGLILPAVFILLSLIWSSSVIKRFERSGPSNESTITHYEYDNEGYIKEKFEKINSPLRYKETSRPGIIITGIGLAALFVTTNIPTVAYLLIYGISREKMRARLEMQKMTIQDLS